MKPMSITKDTFQKEVLDASQTVLVDFWASWCGPCRMLMPAVEKSAETLEGVKVCKVNIDDEPGLAEQYRVMTIPTLMVFKNGKQTKTSVGVISEEEIKALVS